MTKQELLDLEQLMPKLAKIRKLTQRYFYDKFSYLEDKNDKSISVWYDKWAFDSNQKISIRYVTARDDRYGAEPCRWENEVYVTFDELIEFNEIHKVV